MRVPRTAHRFLAAFYAANLASLAAYFLLHRAIGWSGEDAKYRYVHDADHLWYWEKRAGWMLLALAAGKFIRRSTLESFIADVLGYVKLAGVVLLGSADVRLGAWLLIAYLLVFLLFEQPRYDGEQFVDLLTPVSLHRQVLSAAAGGPHWLIMFSAAWSAASAQAQATFAELSLDFAGESLRFAEIDVGRWPQVAKKFDVSIEAFPYQLPAFLLFKHGKMVKRLPEKEKKWEWKGQLRARLQSEFDLDVLLAAGLKA